MPITALGGAASQATRNGVRFQLDVLLDYLPDNWDMVLVFEKKLRDTWKMPVDPGGDVCFTLPVSRRTSAWDLVGHGANPRCSGIVDSQGQLGAPTVVAAASYIL